MNITELSIKNPQRVTHIAIKEASESLERHLKEAGLEDYPDPVKLLKEGYVYCTTAEGDTFLIEKEHATQAVYDDKEIVWFPTSYENSSKLTERFDIVRLITGEFYDQHNTNIVKPKGCRTHYLKSQCFKCEASNVYFHDRSHLVENVEEFALVDKSLVVETVDTGELKIKDRCYEVEGKYYRYRELAPDYHHDGGTIWFDETKKRQIKERAIGVELEYESAGHLCYATLKNSKYRDRWSTVRDGSLPSHGGEFVSVPFKLTELNEVSDMIQFARTNHAVVSRRCGYHVHVSGNDLNYMDLSSLITLAMSVQSEIFSYVSDDRINSEYCQLLDNKFLGFTRIKTKKDKLKAGTTLYNGCEETFKTRHKRSKYQGASRHYWLNIDRMFRFRGKKKEQRTVEFRLCQADWNYEHFNRMILLFFYMVEFAKNKSQNTCRNASLRDVINIAPYNHRKILKELVK